MKKYILLFVIFFEIFKCSNSQAQTRFNKKEVKGKQVTFEVTGHDRPKDKSVGVTNKNNKFSKKEEYNEYRISEVQMQQQQRLADIFRNVFDESKLKALLLEDRMMLMFYVNKSGQGYGNSLYY